MVLADGFTARPSCSQATPLSGTCDHIAPSISGMFLDSLCLAGCSLADAARLLFIIGYHDGHLLDI